MNDLDATPTTALLPPGPVIQTLLNGLAVAQDRREQRGHVSARDMVDGIVQLAQEEWGSMAPLVLTHQGLATSEAVGVALWQLVEAGVVSKREEDRLEDFAQGRDLIAEVVAQTRPALTPAELMHRMARWNPGEALIGRRATSAALSVASAETNDADDPEDPDEPSALGDATGDPASGE